MSDKEEQHHIPTEKKDDAEDKGRSGSGGLLSMVGDPVGKVLEKGLRPIGYPLEKGVTGPLGNAVGGSTRGVLGPLMGNEDERMEVVGGKNKDSYNEDVKLGGHQTSGQNPLGLDQSGRWGFEEEGVPGGDKGGEKKAGGNNPLGL